MAPRGGKRPGAGRKPVPADERRVLLSLRVAPATFEHIERARRDDEPLGRTLDRLLAP